MKKKLISILLTVCMVLALLPTAAFAADSTFTAPIPLNDGTVDCTFVIQKEPGDDSTGGTVVIGTGTDPAISTEAAGDLVIPATVEHNGITYTVVGFGVNTFINCTLLKTVKISAQFPHLSASAFSACSGLESVTIPSSVKTIGASAFAGCSKLESIDIPAGVTTIESAAFAGCAALKSVTIPEGVDQITESLFGACSELVSVTIPPSVKSIGKGAFWGCSKLESVEIPNDVATIGFSAFRDCVALENVTIPNGVTAIADNTFDGCSMLKSVTIPTSVDTIGQSAFYGCAELVSVNIPAGVTAIAQNTFYKCAKLPSIVIPSSVDTIGQSAFYGCAELVNVNIPAGVTAIAQNTFYKCAKLPSIVIPSSVTTIGDSAFMLCKNLSSVTFERVDPPTTFGTNVFSNTHANLKIYVPAGSETAYKTGMTSAYEANIVETSGSLIYGISVDVPNFAHTFPSAEVGYGAQDAKTVWITNTGNQPTGPLTVSLSGGSGTSFALADVSIENIEVGGSHSFTVTPKLGLGAGSYTETVVISGDNDISKSFTVSFTVSPVAPTTKITTQLNFRSVTTAVNCTAATDATPAGSGHAAGCTCWSWNPTGAESNPLLTLNGIHLETASGNALTLPANTTIELADGSENIVITTAPADGGIRSGITAVDALTIRGAGAGTGKLNVTSGSAPKSTSAGINCGGVDDGVTIESGVVTATGGQANTSLGIQSNLEIKGGTVTATGGQATNVSVGISSGKFTLSGGTVTAAGTSNLSGGQNSGIALTTGKLIVSGGNLIAIGGASTNASSFGIDLSGSSSFEMSGGTIVAQSGAASGGGHAYSAAFRWHTTGTLNFNDAVGLDTMAKAGSDTGYTTPAFVNRQKDEGSEITQGGITLGNGNPDNTNYAKDLKLTPKITSVTVTPATTSVTVGNTVTLAAAAAPATANSAVAWTSSDTAVATVSTSGVVTGVKAGTATITATSWADATKSGTATVTVTGGSTGGDNPGGGGGGGSSSGGSSTPSTPGASATVDGKTADLGKTETRGDTTTAILDQTKLNKSLESAKSGGTLTVPVTTTKDSAAVELTAESVAKMAEKDMTLEVKSGKTSYTLPVNAMDTKDILTQLGATDASKVAVTITITNEKSTTVPGEKLVGTPVSFTVSAAYGGKTVVIGRFTSMVSRTIEITKAQAEVLSTAVVLEKGGDLRHVPTRIFTQGGKWCATFSSMTNSTYALIERAASFTDVTGQWYADAANELASRAITKGVFDTSFQGEKAITRAEFAALLVNAFGLPKDAKADFSDVASDAWYSQAVATASAYGIANGIGGGKFSPDATITRQQAMVMIHRAATIVGYTGGGTDTGTFTDRAEVGAWAAEGVAFNLANGLIVGNDGKINPNDTITRAQTATVLLRLLQKAELVDVRTEA